VKGFDGMAAPGLSRLILAGLVSVAAFSAPASAAEKVGEAVRITVRVTGQGGALATGDAIHRDERLRSNASGVGAFLFDDGTKLAVGPNSSVVIDNYVYGGGNTVKKLTLGATKGTLRWISGKSGHQAYKIQTPSGTLGVRGTAFDVYVGANGVTAVTLLNGEAQFCNSSGCQTLRRRCQFVIARPGGAVSKPRGITRSIGLGVSGAEAFPFLSGRASLPRGFLASSSCAGLGGAVGRNNGFNQPAEKLDLDFPDRQRDNFTNNPNNPTTPTDPVNPNNPTTPTDPVNPGNRL
jgi:hypothetical protein